jgi:transcriptional regulator with PAS, ATPase and Fis domain
VKLLHSWRSGELWPVGRSKPRLVDVRVIAATNPGLSDLVVQGSFRRNVFYRLNVHDEEC